MNPRLIELRTIPPDQLTPAELCELGELELRHQMQGEQECRTDTK